MPKFRETPVTFTRDEARKIREAMGESLARVACPRCGGQLTVSDPINRNDSVGASFEVVCEPCRRIAVITEVPGTRSPEENA